MNSKPEQSPIVMSTQDAEHWFTLSFTCTPTILHLKDLPYQPPHCDKMSQLVQRFGMRTVLSIGGACAVGITAWLIYYLTDDSDDDEFKIHKTSRNVVIKVEVKKENIGMIIGRAGSNLKYIEKQTDTRINVDTPSDESSNIRVLSIRGTSDSVHNAEAIIYSQINNQPVLETKELFIPSSAVGRVIGKLGTSIKEIIKKSNAKVDVENSNTRAEKTKITIRGTVDQIALATELVNAKVQEYEEMKAKMNEGLSKRSPYRSLRTQNQQPPAEPISDAESDLKAEKLVSTSSDGSLTVFMSAVTNPDRFWVQIMSDRAVELDQLVEAMTDYYNQKPNQEKHRLDDANPGQIVATLFHLDQKWYRAQVISVTNDAGHASASLELYFVDYGDSVAMPATSVFSLDPSFLGLRFQAIECSLAHVKPVGDSWSEDAISCFEDLTHVAQWKPLVARVESYRDQRFNQRSGSPLPCVSLFDTSGEEKDINISEELISRGFARSAKSPTETSEINGGHSSGGSSDSDTLVENPTTSGGRLSDQNNLTVSPASPNKSTASSDPPGSTSVMSSPTSSMPNATSSIPSSTYERPGVVTSSMPNVSKGKRDDKGEKKKRKF